MTFRSRLRSSRRTIPEPPSRFETLFPKWERIALWVTGSIWIGAWKADGWVQQGANESVALFFGAAYALDVLMIVGFGYHFVTTGVRVYRRLWPRRRRP